MANTYRQAYFHLVFSVKFRAALIHYSWRDQLEKYITGIVQGQGHKLIAIGAASDHIHIFIGYNLNQCIPDLVEHIKTSSDKWIRENRFCATKFAWKKGYGSFTNAHSQVSSVARYVLNQEEHHKKKTFREEYLEMLEYNEIPFEDQYLFEFFD